MLKEGEGEGEGKEQVEGEEGGAVRVCFGEERSWGREPLGNLEETAQSLSMSFPPSSERYHSEGGREGEREHRGKCEGRGKDGGRGREGKGSEERGL